MIHPSPPPPAPQPMSTRKLIDPPLIKGSKTDDPPYPDSAPPTPPSTCIFQPVLSYFGNFVEFLTYNEQDQFRNRFDIENDLYTVEKCYEMKWAPGVIYFLQEIFPCACKSVLFYRQRPQSLQNYHILTTLRPI